MNREEAKAKLIECQEMEPEAGHSTADRILCELLESLGEAEVVEEFYKITRWYA